MYFNYALYASRYLIFIWNPNFITRILSDYIHGVIKNWYTSQIKDPELAGKLIPKYPMGCNRITPSDEYIATYNKPFVKLVTDKIETFTKHGIQTVDQTEYKLDTILFATGFDVLKTADPYKTVTSSGKLLKDIFGDTPMAYLGCAHPELPNYWYLLGPGTGLAHNTIIYMIECQVKLIWPYLQLIL